jgi:hypothetical protein
LTTHIASSSCRSLVCLLYNLMWWSSEPNAIKSLLQSDGHS